MDEAKERLLVMKCPYCGQEMIFKAHYKAHVEWKVEALDTEKPDDFETKTKLERLVLSALLALAPTAEKAAFGSPGAIDLMPIIMVQEVAKAVNHIITAGETGLIIEGSMTPKKAGQILRRTLRLRTTRFWGRSRAYIVVWDAEKIELMRQWFEVTKEQVQEGIEILKQA